jgi:hypothetical protein
MGLEIDHVFVACQNGAPELEPLLRLGFTEGSANVHPGQGTACRRLFFENAYLELIWLQDRREAAAPGVAGLHLAERGDPNSGWNPFGLCFRSTAGAPLQLPFPTWGYQAPYLPAGLSVPIGMNASRPDEPLVFDLARRGKTADLRPTLPLILRW